MSLLSLLPSGSDHRSTGCLASATNFFCASSIISQSKPWRLVIEPVRDCEPLLPTLKYGRPLTSTALYDRGWPACANPAVSDSRTSFHAGLMTVDWSRAEIKRIGRDSSRSVTIGPKAVLQSARFLLQQIPQFPHYWLDCMPESSIPSIQPAASGLGPTKTARLSCPPPTYLLQLHLNAPRGLPP